MGAQGKKTVNALVDNTPSKSSDRFGRVKNYDGITPYQLERLKTGEYIESSDVPEFEPNDVTHGETNLVMGYKITKNKGNSYTIRFRQGASGAYTSSVKVSKAGLESYLKKMKNSTSITFHYDDIARVIKK